MQKKRLLIAGAITYVLLLIAVVALLFAARARATATYATAGQQSHWENYRDEMDRLHEDREAGRAELARLNGQPVEARPPKERSPRPPVLELLENHFAACLAVSVLGTTMVFGVIYGLLMGALLRPGRRFDAEPEEGTAAG